MKWPKLPAQWFSMLGPVTVKHMRLKKARKRALCGLYDWCARSIAIRPGMAGESEWTTMWHEATHVALFDAGMHGNTLTKEQEESVCDVMGAYLAAMMRAGALTVNPNWKDSDR